jgi:hypothetical protein
MNRETQWRLDFATELSERLVRFQWEGIQAIAVGGSVARGFSDAYSDLELIVLWHKAPNPKLRQQIMSELGAEFRYAQADPGHDSALSIGGLDVDLWHLVSAEQEAMMHQVLVEYSLDLVANNRLDTFQNCIPLFGYDLLNEWKATVHQYPEELAVRFVKAYLPHFHLRQLELVARRDNPTVYFHILSDIQCSLFVVLLALNQAYFPTYKWMYPILETFAVAPPQLALRLRQMFSLPPLAAVAQLHSVLAETLSLIEERYPQVDTSFARYSLDQTPTPFRPLKPLP